MVPTNIPIPNLMMALTLYVLSTGLIGVPLVAAVYKWLEVSFEDAWLWLITAGVSMLAGTAVLLNTGQSMVQLYFTSIVAGSVTGAVLTVAMLKPVITQERTEEAVKE